MGSGRRGRRGRNFGDGSKSAVSHLLSDGTFRTVPKVPRLRFCLSIWANFPNPVQYENGYLFLGGRVSSSNSKVSGSGKSRIAPAQVVRVRSLVTGAFSTAMEAVALLNVGYAAVKGTVLLCYWRIKPEIAQKNRPLVSARVTPMVSNSP